MISGHVMRLAFTKLARTRGAWLCQSLALAAIMAPLLIIFGLKYGLVESMKEALLSNPAAREIVVDGSVSDVPGIMERMEHWPELAFAVPSVGYVYSRVNLAAGHGGEETEAELIPTADGDPLLLNTGCGIPEEGEAVISANVARQLDIRKGDTLTVRAYRDSQREVLQKQLRVCSVLDERYDAGSSLYVPLSNTVELENFLISGSGQAGSDASLMGELYDGVMLGKEAGEEMAAYVSRRVPFVEASRCEQGEENEGAFLLSRKGGARMAPVHAQVLIDAADSKGISAWAWVKPFRCRLVSGEKTEEVLLIGDRTDTSSLDLIQAPPTISLPPGVAHEEDVELQTCGKKGESRIVCRVEEDATVPVGTAKLNIPLMALLKYGRDQVVDWDYRSGGLRFPVLSFVSMRVYARTLEDTERLLYRLVGEKVPCHARLNTVRQVLAIEKGLDRLFAVLCIGVVVGAVVSFGLSLFNAAELHRRDYALVQLLGVNRMALAWMPLIEALVVASVGVMLAFGSFYATQSVISMIFSETMGSNMLCRLSFRYIGFFCSSAAGLAILASLAATFKVLRITPSEIIHEL